MNKNLFEDLNKFVNLFTNTGAIVILDDNMNTKVSYSKLGVLLDDLKTEGDELIYKGGGFKLKNIHSFIMNEKNDEMFHRISYKLYNESKNILIKTKSMDKYQLLHFQDSIKKCFKG